MYTEIKKFIEERKKVDRNKERGGERCREGEEEEKQRQQEAKLTKIT